MVTIWFAKDGPRPNSQSGPGIVVTSEDANAIFGSLKKIFVGTDAPSINSDKPSHSLKNVVLEIDNEKDISSLFPEFGFYIIPGLTPEEAQHELNAHRTRKPYQA